MDFTENRRTSSAAFNLKCVSKLEKGGLQNLCVHGNATLQCYLTWLGLHHQNKLSSVHQSLVIWHYFVLSEEVMLLCIFISSGVLQRVSETPSSHSLPQGTLGEKDTPPKNIKWQIQELEDLCGHSLWNHQSRTFSAMLLRRVSGTYGTSSSHTSILLFCVPSFHMVVKDGYPGTWVLARFEIGACRREGREDQELHLDLPG